MLFRGDAATSQEVKETNLEKVKTTHGPAVHSLSNPSYSSLKYFLSLRRWPRRAPSAWKWSCRAAS